MPHPFVGLSQEALQIPGKRWDARGGTGRVKEEGRKEGWGGVWLPTFVGLKSRSWRCPYKRVFLGLKKKCMGKVYKSNISF